jgi:uncharacterized protein (DUF302 family)
MSPLHVTLPTPLPATRAAVEAAFKAEGFGVLTEIDVQATLREKLGAAHEGHRILGICNPHLAKQALDIDRDVALLLPCTVTLRELADGGTEVRVLDPKAAFTLAAPDTRARLEPLADDVAARLGAALSALADASRGLRARDRRGSVSAAGSLVLERHARQGQQPVRARAPVGARREVALDQALQLGIERARLVGRQVQLDESVHRAAVRSRERHRSLAGGTLGRIALVAGARHPDATVLTPLQQEACPGGALQVASRGACQSPRLGHLQHRQRLLDVGVRERRERHEPGVVGRAVDLDRPPAARPLLDHDQQARALQALDPVEHGIEIARELVGGLAGAPSAAEEDTEHVAHRPIEQETSRRRIVRPTAGPTGRRR